MNSVNQAWLVKEIATQIWQRGRKNRIRNVEEMAVKLKEKRKGTVMPKYGTGYCTYNICNYTKRHRVSAVK